MSATHVLEPLAQVPAAAPQDDLIFDIGMNICEDTDFYLKKGFRVVAVEADPAACASAVARHEREIAEGRLSVVNRAISDQPEPLAFYVCHTKSAWSTASRELRDRRVRDQGASFEEILVPTTTLAELIAEHGTPYYLKTDIEGLDLVGLKALRAAALQPRYVSAAVDFYTRAELISLLEELGYRRFALVGQKSVPGQQQPAEPREGRRVEHSFHGGCSGLFGRELPAPWVSAEQVRARCEAIVRQYRLSGALGRLERAPFLAGTVARMRQAHLPLAQDWYDLHAAL